MKDYSILQAIAENSGRKSFITDSQFNVLWTNSDMSVDDLLKDIPRSEIGALRDGEHTCRCGGNSVLKLIPIIEDGTVVLYFIEIYSDEQILKIFSKSASFNVLANDYDSFRNALSGNVKDVSKNEKLLDRTANRALILEILSDKGRKNTLFDVGVPIEHCCGIFKLLSGETERFVMNVNSKAGLYAYANAEMFECILTELLVNAVMYSTAEKQQIRVRTSSTEENVIIEITDNGNNADLTYIQTFREIRLADSADAKEATGIALAQLFADNCGGRLELENTKMGGLLARIILKKGECDKPNSSQFLSLYDSLHLGTVKNILRKGFPSSDVVTVEKHFKL